MNGSEMKIELTGVRATLWELLEWKKVLRSQMGLVQSFDFEDGLFISARLSKTTFQFNKQMFDKQWHSQKQTAKYKTPPVNNVKKVFKNINFGVEEIFAKTN